MIISNKYLQGVKSKDGFTLVELLIVVAIVGMLALIAIPAFFSQSKKAKSADAKSSVRNAMTDVVSLKDANGNWSDDTVNTSNKLIYELNNPGPGESSAYNYVNAYTSPTKSTDVLVDRTNDNMVNIAARSADGVYFCAKVPSGKGFNNQTRYGTGTDWASCQANSNTNNNGQGWDFIPPEEAPAQGDGGLTACIDQDNIDTLDDHYSEMLTIYNALHTFDYDENETSQSAADRLNDIVTDPDISFKADDPFQEGAFVEGLDNANVYVNQSVNWGNPSPRAFIETITVAGLIDGHYYEITFFTYENGENNFNGAVTGWPYLPSIFVDFESVVAPPSIADPDSHAYPGSSMILYYQLNSCELYTP